MANKWIGVSANLNPAFLQDIKALIDPVFAFVQTTLDLVNAVLQFVQAFLTAIGNPIKAILQQLINLLKGFLRDLRNTGIYVTYDTFAQGVPVISEDNLKKLAGGYPTFEQRTITKFTNATDPTRPNFSKASSLLCIHAFGGGDLTSFFRIYNAIEALKKLFSNEAVKASLPVATNLSFEYRGSLLGVSNAAPLKKKDISENNLPTHLRVKWSLVPPSTNNGVFSSYVSPPPSFLIHISSLPQGLILGYDKIITGNVVKEGLLADPNNPNLGFRWYGLPDFIAGWDNKDSSKEAFYYKLLPQDPKEQRILDYDVARELQQTYYKETNAFLSGIGGNDYYIDIPIDKLPFDPSVSSTEVTTTKKVTENCVYVTVQSTNLVLNVASETLLKKEDVEDFPVYVTDIFKKEVAYSPLRALSFVDGVQASDFAQPIPVDVNFKPKAKYLSALREALSWFLLARLDKIANIPVQDDDGVMIPFESLENVLVDGEEVILRPTMNSDFPGCVALGVELTDSEYKKALNILDIPTDAVGKKALDSYFKKDKWAFASFIKDRVDRAVEKTTDFGFPPYELLFANEELFDNLYTASKEYFGDEGISLYEALSDNNFFTENYELYGGEDSYTQGEINANLRQALTGGVGFYFGKLSQVRLGMLTEIITENTFLVNDYPFVVKSDGNLTDYPPWCWIDYKRAELAGGIEAVIRMSITPLKYRQRDPDQGEWQFIKFFRDGFPAFEQYLQAVIDFAQKFADALNNIIQGIIDFIKVLQQRILELKRFIAKLKAIIDAILSFSLPADLSFLYTLSAGTQGAVRDLIQAEDKPQIRGQYAFGMGASLVIGAPVPFVTEIFDLIFGG